MNPNFQSETHSSCHNSKAWKNLEQKWFTLSWVDKKKSQSVSHSGAVKVQDSVPQVRVLPNHCVLQCQCCNVRCELWTCGGLGNTTDCLSQLLWWCCNQLDLARAWLSCEPLFFVILLPWKAGHVCVCACKCDLVAAVFEIIKNKKLRTCMHVCQSLEVAVFRRGKQVKGRLWLMASGIWFPPNRHKTPERSTFCEQQQEMLVH